MKSINFLIYHTIVYMTGMPYFIKAVLYIILINLVFTIVTISWITEEDVNNLPEPVLDKFISIFFSGVTMFASTDLGDLSPKSKRMRLYMSIYIISSFLFVKNYL
jgi:hypothetical protein